MAVLQAGKGPSRPNDAARLVDLVGATDGTVQLVLTSATQITLNPKGGCTLVVNGGVTAIPSAGVPLSNSGLAASTLYRIYDGFASGTHTLVASTTAHVTDSAGRENLSGDATKRLVGMVYTDANGKFALLRSYFNDPGFTASGNISGSTASTSPTPLGGSVPFLAWADEIVSGDIVGNAVNNAAGNVNYTTTMIDGVAVGGTQPAQAYAASVYTAIGVGSKSRVSEGYHQLQVGASVSNGNNGASWNVLATVATMRG